MSEKKELSSVKVLYNVAQKEYELENNRTKNLDAKANMLLVISMSPLLFVLKDGIQWKIFCNIFSTPENITSYEHRVSALIVLLIMLLLFSLVSCILKVLYAISIKAYKHIDIAAINEDIYKYTDEVKYSLYATTKYDMAVQTNRSVNNKKASLIKDACELLFMDIILFSLYVVVLQLSGIG